ncbi:MAG TPA: SCO family protein [Pyrinomonadaceae bacterium]|jgi:cytochrome oxidase Cu insertion factor (SCO1/SenC/PrrC family)|nr:SCO family protein [Pyrinomonadaceae bacterium]
MKKYFILLIVLTLFAVNCVNIMTAQATSPASQETAAKAVYTCPMHPEVKSKKRGKCPKCKMDLVRQTAVASDEMSQPAVESVNIASAGSKTLNIPDVEVLDQDGNVRHFYSDLIKGKTVAINFIFTNCTTICPPLGATFARVQRELGDKDVRFISVSVDPLTDTPERLKAWGAKFKAGAGWTFVTGNKQEIDQLLRALGASAARREDHTPSVVVGNDAKGVWTRSYGLAKTTQMVSLIENVIAGKVDESIAKESTQP